MLENSTVGCMSCDVSITVLQGAAVLWQVMPGQSG